MEESPLRRTSALGLIWGPHSVWALALVTAVFVVDQAHKWWMLEIYGIIERAPVRITSFFNLVFVKNTGISYGMLAQDGHGGQWTLAALALATSLALWIWTTRPGQSRLLVASLALIIGGALGNAMDRVLIGGVADFFHLHAFGWSWYVFNIADIAIVAGVAGLLYESFVPNRKDAAKGS